MKSSFLGLDDVRFGFFRRVSVVVFDVAVVVCSLVDDFGAVAGGVGDGLGSGFGSGVFSSFGRMTFSFLAAFLGNLPHLNIVQRRTVRVLRVQVTCYRG